MNVGRVVIVGGSISGLAVGLLLARRGVEVEILERDEIPSTGSLESNDPSAWWRKGAPQARHTHACAALARRILLEHAPDVWSALVDAGAVETPIGADLAGGALVPRCDDPELVGLGVRRPVVESVLRQRTLAEPKVTTRRTTVTGLLTIPGDPPRVTGVTTTTGDVAADHVIDASGRASALVKWLTAVGIQPPIESVEPCGLVYFTRWFRVNRYPEVRLTTGLSSGGMGQASLCVACPADHGTLSVTLAVRPDDEELRAIGKGAAFDAAARLHPFVGPWFEPGVLEPLTDVLIWPGLENRYRRFAVDGRPVAVGLAPVGDSVCITNPTFTRGISLALRHGFAVAEAIARNGAADLSLALSIDELGMRLLRPWFDDAVLQDRNRTRRWVGESPEWPASPSSLTLDDVFAAARHDLDVWRAASRRYNMLDEPGAIFENDVIVARIRSVLATPRPAPVGPSRADLLRAAEQVNDAVTHAGVS